MISIIPAIAIVLLALVVIFQPLATWAIGALVIAGILIFITTETGTRFRSRGGI
jgi:hypothetical protein